jgi:redox-sensitive bicupin YhaK (pirin superfamily)
MALKDTGTDPSSQRGPQEAARDAVKELQSLTVKVVAGAAANTNIPVAGLDLDDVIVSVLHFDIATGTVVDVLDKSSEAVVLTTGNLQLTTTVTTGDKLVVIFFASTAGA